MDKELLRLINILKTVPEIKESIEELKFGCRFLPLLDSFEKGCFGRMGMDLKIHWNFGYGTTNWDKKNDRQIIGQIHEGHLRMFFEIYGRTLNFSTHGGTTLLIIDEGDCLEFDNSKPFMSQSEDFYKKLCDWIEKHFNLI